jgi:hypothetical protein
MGCAFRERASLKYQPRSIDILRRRQSNPKELLVSGIILGLLMIAFCSTAMADAGYQTKYRINFTVLNYYIPSGPFVPTGSFIYDRDTSTFPLL